MTDYGLPILATLALWWGSTGAIFYVDNLPPRTFRYTMIGATALVALALWGLVATSDNTTTGAAYGAFSYGLICWGWQIVSYYTGFVTGPRNTPCPPELRGLSRFVEAVRTSLYHEMFALAGAALLLAITHGHANNLGFWTYVTLWWMHESAKLNVFFGVPNLGEEMLPEHLRYLATYMTRRPMNVFFPFSVTISTVITVLLAQRALSPTATSFEAAGYAMLSTMMILAIAEHWFLVTPFHANALWTWSGQRAPRTRVGRDLLMMGAAGSLTSVGVSGALESWSPDPPALCDAGLLHRVLETIGTGAFGEVECVRGVVRTHANWICFELAGQSASMSSFSPKKPQEPLVIAMGRRFDRVRLQAAFDACAAPI